MKTGVVTSFNPERGVGTIFVNSVVGERYFFYQNKIIAGPQPVVGSQVMFNVSIKPPRPGHLPFAVNITVLEKKADIAALKSLAGGGE